VPEAFLLARAGRRGHDAKCSRISRAVSSAPHFYPQRIVGPGLRPAEKECSRNPEVIKRFTRRLQYCVIIRFAMPWSTAPSSLFLAAGQANQIAFGFADVWAGPQYATAKLDRAEGGTAGGLKILVVQWQGTATDGNVALGLPPKSYYLLGVNNTSDSNIWFHLEGGRAA
jgi:hypothetical protein